jgi:uncharacterized protein YcnI
VTDHHPRRGRRPAALVAIIALALLLPGFAFAHARVSPLVSVAGATQLYSLAVPTEQANATTTKIVLSVPAGFAIDSFVPSPGWRRSLRERVLAGGSVVQTVTWSGGAVPTGEDALFQFLAQATKVGSYAFQVEQTYSNGVVVEWAGPESSASPAATIEIKSSLGGGGTPLLTIVALVVAAVALVVAAIAVLAGSGGRQLA